MPDNTIYRTIESGTTGSISSPNYPGDYPSSTTLHWVLTAPVGKRIQMSFKGFELSLDDYLTVSRIMIWLTLNLGTKLYKF